MKNVLLSDRKGKELCNNSAPVYGPLMRDRTRIRTHTRGRAQLVRPAAKAKEYMKETLIIALLAGQP